MTEVLTTIIFDAETGETTERPFTEEEVANLAQMQADQEVRDAELVAKEEAKANGMAKLIALGLTQEEAGALING